MKTTFKDTKEAPVKWWAAQDARMRNIANKSHWSSAIQLRVAQISNALELMYYGKVYEAYGKKQVSIKIDKAQPKDKKWIEILEADWAAEGISKTCTPQGIIYTIRG